MKPFDLKKALAGEPVITRDGRAVIRLVHLPEVKNTGYKLVGVIQGQDTPFLYFEDGRLMASVVNIGDLFMAPQKKTVWVNIWRSTEGTMCSSQYPLNSEQKADEALAAMNDPIGTFPIEIEI